MTGNEKSVPATRAAVDGALPASTSSIDAMSSNGDSSVLCKVSLVRYDWVIAGEGVPSHKASPLCRCRSRAIRCCGPVDRRVGCRAGSYVIDAVFVQRLEWLLDAVDLQVIVEDAVVDKDVGASVRESLDTGGIHSI